MEQLNDIFVTQIANYFVQQFVGQCHELCSHFHRFLVRDFLREFLRSYIAVSGHVLGFLLNSELL
jgi:hypothetical protein